MKLSAVQTKTFLRLQRKHNVSTAFILHNMPAILKFVQYAITPHMVLKQKLIRRRNRVFLRYNHLRKLIFDPSQLKKRRQMKRIHSQWSKRLVVHLRRFKTVEFVEEQSSADAMLPKEDVSKKLKEQLELLKSGKRTIPLLEELYAEQRASASVSVEETSDTEDGETEMETETTTTEDTQMDTLSDRTETPLPTMFGQVESVDKFSSQDERAARKPLPDVSERRSGNFLDMLISKVKNTADEPQMEPPRKCVKATPSKEIVQTSVDERENSNSSSDFFGFDDNERILGTSPGMLMTPLVHNRDSNSAFESETLNAYMRDNSLESSAVMKFPLRRSGDGLVFANSIPPKLDIPALPEGLQGLRTVAERRSFLQRTRNVKYCIINNVNIIYHELQKRTKGHRINKHSIESLQSSTVPLTRQGWKAATWLLTDVGNYFYQTIKIDGENYRLYGCRGNSPRKYIRPHSSKCTKISMVCPEGCIDRITFRLFRPIRTLERRSKLGDASLKITYKACPLSQKIAQQVQEDEAVFDSLEIVQMPQVEMEVFPHLHKPLHDIAKRYLQLILPYDGISREWAEFSVSTLLDRQHMKTHENSNPSYTFKLPYRNDRSHVLVQRIHSRSEAFEGQLESSELSFRKEIDQKRADGESPDSLAEECADILSDMLNSVAISSSENSFLKDDPDNIYQKIVDDDFMAEKSVKKMPELHQQHVAGQQNKKQSRLLMELRRLNATIIDAAVSKTEEDAGTCDKESCRLGCVCASINEGFTVRQHCGKQRCILDCNCKCPTVMRLETDGRTITTEDAFMLRRQATAKLARVEKEFTSTIVLTGSETLLINESQYDKKRRCTKIPKRYGDFIDPDESDFNDNKTVKKVEPPTALNFPLEPVLVKDKIYQNLKHCSVNVKRMRDVNELVPWCMVHMVYKCYCKGNVTVGNPIVVEKQEEQQPGGTTIEEAATPKPRTLYSFEKEETRASDTTSSYYESDTSISNTSDLSYIQTTTQPKPRLQSGQQEKLETRGRKLDVDCIGIYLNSKANHCRRVVAIPKNTYQRKNKKRLAEVHLFIAENETEQTRLSLNEHVLRSVYYHRHKRTHQVPVKLEQKPKVEDQSNKSSHSSGGSQNKSSGSLIAIPEKRKLNEDNKVREDNSHDQKRSRLTSTSSIEEGTSLLRVNRYKEVKRNEVPPDHSKSEPPIAGTSTYTPQPFEQITVPKISQIFSLNTQAMEMDTETGAAVAAYIPEQSSDAATCAEGVSSDAFKSVFNVVIKNMNNLVSKKMQDIDMALRRESKAIPAPNDEILCIIRWNNFLEAFMSGFVYLWEVRTINMTFIAATIKNMMPLVVNALSVVNIRALPKDGLPLLGRMLMDRLKNSVTDGLAVVMQGQKMYWFVKGFLRPDKTRICPKPTPQTHPLLTKKINILCRLLINQQMNELKRRQERLSPEFVLHSNATLPQVCDIEYPQQNRPSSSTSASQSPPLPPASPPPPPAPPAALTQTIALPAPTNTALPKVKVLPMQRNISDHATVILEQMVTQAYGMVRSNISSRKLHQTEVKDIYMPTNIQGDHQWLILDISTDFSHIFIPELRDLLTLDRIQKVMAYAVTKSRIVKMQFCQKPLFNAYVTPVSNRKLYFGPFWNAYQAPQLILLQSVDGQMMLREVYEARHQIALKTDKTCSFWLTQRQGKLFLDVQQETPLQVLPKDDGILQVQPAEPIQEIVDDDDILFVQNENENGIDAVVNKAHDEVVVVKNACEPPAGEQTNKPDEEDDDDCMIIDVDADAGEAAGVDYETLVPAAPIEAKKTERINYTISYTGENSSLVVTQSECEYVPDSAQNTFTILTPEVAPQPITNTQELVQNNVINMQPQQLTQEPAKNVNKDFEPINISPSPFVKAVSHERPHANAVVGLQKHISLVQSSSATKQTCIYVKKIMPPQPMTMNPVRVETKKNEPAVVSCQPNNDRSQQNVKAIQLQPSVLESTQNAIKWNNNVTITKLPIDGAGHQCSTPEDMSNSQAVLSTLKRKSMTMLNTTGRIMVQNSNGRFSLPSNVQPQTSKSKVIPANDYRQHLLNQAPKPPKITKLQAPTKQISPKQPVVKKIEPPKVFHPQYSTTAVRSVITARPTLAPRTVVIPRPVFTPRPTVTPQHSLSPQSISIRTPTAINTLVRRQPQQQVLQHPPPTTSTVVTTNSTSSTVTTNTTSTANTITTLVGGSLVKVFNPAGRVRPSSTISPMNAVFFKSPTNVAASTANVKSAAASEKKLGQFTRIVTKNSLPAGVGPPNKIQKLASGEAAGRTESPQSDPLHISDEMSDTAVDDLPLTKLPKDLKTIRITATSTQPKAASSTGTIVNSASTQTIPAKPPPTSTLRSNPNPNTVVTSVANTLTLEPQAQIKGIPVELPRLKKFAIIGSANTTVITPLAPQSGETKVQTEADGGGSSSIAESSAQKKEIILGTAAKPCPPAIPINTKTASKASSSFSSQSSVTLNPTIHQKHSMPEYGYFSANMDGLPKFVVKRVGDDFLIKVPNFNGILKLTGWATVHNYLNQYTTQKCGKTAADIANLKWIFRAQDRSKLNTINRTNSKLMKPATSTPAVQKVINLFNINRATQKSASTSTTTSPTKVGNLTATPNAAAIIQKPDAKTPVVLVDDE